MRHKNLGADLSIIIPAAGISYRMKSHGIKSLIELNYGETVIDKQLTTLNQAYPRSEKIVVVGFEAEKLIQHLGNRVKVVENEFYQDTNVVRSVGMGLRVASNDRVIILHNDILFNQYALNGLVAEGSTAIVDSKNRFAKEEVGLTEIDGYANYFSYGLDLKWGQIIFLTHVELDLFREVSCIKDKRKLYMFEALNEVIDLGGKIRILEPKYMKIAEIDTTKDIELAKRTFA